MNNSHSIDFFLFQGLRSDCFSLLSPSLHRPLVISLSQNKTKCFPHLIFTSVNLRNNLSGRRRLFILIGIGLLGRDPTLSPPSGTSRDETCDLLNTTPTLYQLSHLSKKKKKPATTVNTFQINKSEGGNSIYPIL